MTVIVLQASHKDVTSHFNPIEFSPAENLPE